VEQHFKNKKNKQQVTPFLDAANIKRCHCSIPLQRRITDFYAERSLDDTVQALLTHYNIEQNRSSINTVVQQIAREAKHFNAEQYLTNKDVKLHAETLIVEVDGSMIPIVEYGSKATEDIKIKAPIEKKSKKTRSCHWREIRLCTVKDFKSEVTTYGTVLGSPVEVGLMMEQCCKNRGYGENSWVHGVADGAPWIEEQYETIFGTNHTFLIDFYHLMEYISSAGDVIYKDSKMRKQWREKQKSLLLNNESKSVIAELRKWLKKSKDTEGEKVKACLRYMENREGNLDYKTAKEKGLPIGSGEVESAHKSIIQKRLKLTGAWWKIEHAENVVNLRVMRANKLDSKFWTEKVA
jgi:hypothetical protein